MCLTGGRAASQEACLFPRRLLKPSESSSLCRTSRHHQLARSPLKHSAGVKSRTNLQSQSCSVSFFFCCHIYDSVVCHIRPSLPANSSSFCRPATGSEMSQLLLTCRQKNRRSIFQIHSDYSSLNTRAGLWLVVSEIGQTLVSSVSCSEAEDAFKYL